MKRRKRKRKGNSLREREEVDDMKEEAERGRIGGHEASPIFFRHRNET